MKKYLGYGILGVLGSTVAVTAANAGLFGWLVFTTGWIAWQG